MSVLRTNIVIDFWNFTLSMRTYDTNFLADWFAIPRIFVREAEKIIASQNPGTTLSFNTMHIIGSIGPGDAKLNGWAKNILSKIPGSRVQFLQRQKQKTAFCCTGPCHHEITACPECGSPMLGYKEKGVDTTISNILLREAWEGLYDVVILISSDRDFIPTIAYLHSLNKKSIHAGFKNTGNELAATAWASLEIDAFCRDFQRENPQ